MRKITTNEEFGQRVKEIVKSSGDTKEVAAAKLGVSIATLSHVFSGRNRFKLDNLIKFCQEYNTSLDELYFSEKESNPAEYDTDVLAQIVEVIEKWENRNRVRMPVKYKIKLAFAFYPDVIVENKENRDSKVIVFMDVLEKLGKVEKSA